MKTINIVNKVVAANLGIELKTVEKINKLYWKEIVHYLSSVEEDGVHIKKIGTITASPYKTNNYIRKMINRIRKVKKSTKYIDSTKEVMIKQATEYLRKLLKKRNQFAKQYYKKPCRELQSTSN